MRDRSGSLSGSSRLADPDDAQASLPPAVTKQDQPAPSSRRPPDPGEEPSDAPANVSDMTDQATDAGAFELPTKRTFNPTQLGHSAPLFQFDAKKLRRDVSVPTLVGVVASAKGAPLASREFDVLTVLSRWFLDAPEDRARAARRAAVRAGASTQDVEAAADAARAKVITDGFVETTMYKLTQAIYGQVSKERYEALGRAIDNLKAVTITVPGFDAEQGTFNAHALSKVNLISKVVITDQQHRFDEARRENPRELARVFGRAKGQITLKIQLDDWIRDAIINRFGADLNFDVQRALKGQAKALWVQLEAFQFAEDLDGRELEHYELPMNDETFAGLRLNCHRPSDNVAKIRTRLNAILDTDPAYVGYEQVRDPDDGRRVHSIVVTRATGTLRQQRLRAAQGPEQAATPKELTA